MNPRSLVHRGVPAATILVGLILMAVGCVRMDVLPQAKKETSNLVVQPRPIEKLVVPHQKDPTHVYRIGPRDILQVNVRKDPSLYQVTGYPVTEEGNILLPNGIGPVNVTNLTATEVEKRLNDILSEYIIEPDVKVGIMTYLSKKVYVYGQVNKPGEIIMRADMLTLQEAIVLANLPTPNAAVNRVLVISPDVNNRPVIRQIDLSNILYKGKMAENILLRPGDVVVVPSKHANNLANLIRDIIRPADEIFSFQYRASYGGLYNNNNDNNNDNNSNSNNNNSRNNNGNFGLGGLFGR